MTEEKEEGFDKVKEGFKKVVGGSAEVVEGSAQEIKEAVEDTSEDIKEGAEDVKEGVEETGEEIEEGVDEAVDSDTYTGNEDAGNREYDESGGKEPMNPEDIASHEPTAVKRDKNQGTSGDPV